MTRNAGCVCCASSSLAMKSRRSAGKSKLGDAGVVTSLRNSYRRRPAPDGDKRRRHRAIPAAFLTVQTEAPDMKKLRIVSQFFALASFVLWGTAALSQTIVPMISDGGTFRVPVTINDELTLKFVIDSGAADVSVPADVVMTLVRTGTITDTDFLGKQTYKLADGSTVPSQQFVIRSLKVGDKTLENVVGSIAPVAGGLLLGQSFLSRFNTWSIDNQRQALILGPPPNNDTALSSAEVPDERVHEPIAPHKPEAPAPSLSAYIREVSAAMRSRLFYPNAARSRRAKGVVGVSFTIGPSGAVSSFAITRSSGDHDLDAAARSLVQGGRFPPPPGGLARITTSFFYVPH